MIIIIISIYSFLILIFNSNLTANSLNRHWELISNNRQMREKFNVSQEEESMVDAYKLFH